MKANGTTIMAIAATAFIGLTMVATPSYAQRSFGPTRPTATFGARIERAAHDRSFSPAWPTPTFGARIEGAARGPGFEWFEKNRAAMIVIQKESHINRVTSLLSRAHENITRDLNTAGTSLKAADIGAIINSNLTKVAHDAASAPGITFEVITGKLKFAAYKIGDSEIATDEVDVIHISSIAAAGVATCYAAGQPREDCVKAALGEIDKAFLKPIQHESAEK